MKSPDDHGALDPARCLEEFITPLGFPAPEMEEIEIFHETTKLKRFHHRTLGRRIGTYLVDERAVIETVNNYKVYGESEVIPLPPPTPVSATLAQIISTRKSCRSFSGEAISLEELSQILSAVRATRKLTLSVEKKQELWFRPYPSGGGLYPSEIYVILRNVKGIEPGVMHYAARQHAFHRIGNPIAHSHLREALGDEDGHTLNIGAVFLITSLCERSVVKYGYRGYRFAMMEAGMIPLMLNLAATGIGLGALHWGGFLDDRVNGLLDLDGVSESVTSCLL